MEDFVIIYWWQLPEMTKLALKRAVKRIEMRKYYKKKLLTENKDKQIIVVN